MLQSISIQNYALIDTLDISFDKGFSVITGETGAGKSIILGAIGLLLGQRADVKAIKQGASKCVIEAHFNISSYQMQSFFDENELEYDSNECILRRELQASGKSRAFINDSPAPLTLMKELGEQLIDVHSQHQNLLLNKEDFQLNVLDSLANDEKELSSYKEAYQTYRKVAEELNRLIELEEQSRTDEDYVRFQLEQFDEAKLVKGEDAELEKEEERLNHAEEIKEGLYNSEQILMGDEGGLLSNIKKVSGILRSLKEHYNTAGDISDRVENLSIELKEIARDLAREQENIEVDPGRLDFVNERLNLIYTLEKKHHVSTLEELLNVQDEFRARMNAISSFAEQIEVLQKQKEELLGKVKKAMLLLTDKRTHAAKKVEHEMQNRLIPLGMPNVRFKVHITPKANFDATGGDNVAFIFSANKNATLQNISSVASGGEIARVMLSIKAMIAGATQLPTIIFDEIDTGVSGEIADKMAEIMKEMGACMQVISITHLPQIAAKGKVHYKVYKQDNETSTSSNIRRLKEEERVEEIAHMLSGATLTDAAMNNAKELLKEYGKE
ncbi:DNA repair protein RecN [uncultured Bacteroides sp.]|uniref:DNA repair protein RecN n=1 Tax=uncultured Bacteroides sp. TaxID=162156 RepID=UPI002AAAFD02|nr:DNA repair protein RecN [uncultured Bacteroides sp.]